MKVVVQTKTGRIAAAIRKRVIILGVLSAILAGCAASSGYTTRAYPTVPKPTADSDDYVTWMDYYTDQFASVGEKVEAPSPSASENAKKAYADAKSNWDKHVSASELQMQQSKKAANTMWYAIGGVAAALLVLNLAVF